MGMSEIKRLNLISNEIHIGKPSLSLRVEFDVPAAGKRLNWIRRGITS